MEKATVRTMKNIIKKHQDSLLREFHVGKIGIFGSAVRNDFKKGSDIDILIDLKKPIGFMKFLDLEEFLSTKLGRKVDLVTRNALKSAIKEEVLRDIVYV